MQDADNDGWEDVTDPRELKAIGGVSAVTAATKAAGKAPSNAGVDRPWDAPAVTPNAKAASEAYAKVVAARNMRAQLARVRELYDRDMADQGLGGLKEYNPFRKENQQFDGAVAAIPLLARQAFRVVGSGADTDRELQLVLDALPDRKSFDGTNKERFRTLETVLGGFLDSYGGVAGFDAKQIARMKSEHQYRPKGLPKAPPRATPAAPQSGWKVTRK